RFVLCVFFFSSRRRHTRCYRDWSSDVCSSDLTRAVAVWHVAALAAFLGLVNAFDIPARQAFIVELVEKDDLVSAIALNSSAFNAAGVIGPAVAGAVIGVAGVVGCVLLDWVGSR